METSTETSEWQKRYAVIEKAYCESRWATVVEAGTHLLRDLLEAEEAPAVKALRHRMQLLMAHTLLHGYGDRDAAEDLYEIVRQSDAEATLRQIAEDGLDQCHQPLISTLAAQPEEPEEEDDLEHARPMLFLPETERIDLEDEAGPPPPSAKAPSSASFLPPTPRPARPAELRPEPREVETPPAANALVRAPIPEQSAAGPISWGVAAADPFALTGSEAKAAVPQGGAPVMPWLSQPGTAEPPEVAMPSDLPWLQEAATPSPSVSPALIPDVVDEPELLELHQSSPLLAEEVDVPIRSAAPAPESRPEPTLEEAEVDGDLRTGLLLVVVG